MKAIITGSDGLLGSALKKKLSDNDGHLFLNRNKIDLLNYKSVCELFEGIKNDGYDTLIHCAAKVGGVNANMLNPKLFFEQNTEIDYNILSNAYKNNIENVVTVLSTCIFPDKATYPLTIDQLDKGRPHDSNYGYAYAKRLLAYQTKMYREVTGNNWISIVPTNMYGEHDNFNLEASHIIPALIRKAFEASESGGDFVIWGDGTPLRQFVFSEDMAGIIIQAIGSWKSGTPMIAVDEREYSIKEIVDVIAARFDISAERVKYDSTKPNGQHRKPAKSDITGYEFISLEVGVNKTIDWFIGNKGLARV